MKMQSYPKNHGISKLVGTEDPRALQKTESNPSFLEGPMILRVFKMEIFLPAIFAYKR